MKMDEESECENRQMDEEKQREWDTLIYNGASSLFFVLAEVF